MSAVSTTKNNFESLGQVYLWCPDIHNPAGGTIKKAIVPLPYLFPSANGKLSLSSPFTIVENAGYINLPDKTSSSFKPTALNNAQANSTGDFIFEPFNGGGRMDKVPLVDEWRRFKNIESARFGEVNTFYHINKIASYVNHLLTELGEKSLPIVKVKVNAHPAIFKKEGPRDGVLGKTSKKWLPLQGGHYRLSASKQLEVQEPDSISTNGEIHLGSGWKLSEFGVLSNYANCKYRCNASHNAGIIYHEYGHHITRFTADFMANRFSVPHRQSNRKTDIDEGISDYWAATMLDSPHIWAWHRKHTKSEIHHRSLASNKTIDDFDKEENADPHLNGTILAAILWNIRTEIKKSGSDGHKKMDLLVLKTLVLIGQLQDSAYRPTKSGTRKCRSGFSVFLIALIKADEILYDAKHLKIISSCFLKRGISHQTFPVFVSTTGFLAEKTPKYSLPKQDFQASIRHVLEKDINAIIPKTDELLTRQELEDYLDTNKLGPFTLTAVGDIMLGERMNRPIKKFGSEYPFYSVNPIFRRSNIVLGNLEGPFAKYAVLKDRNFSYKVNPKKAGILRRAGFNVMTLANNHLLDCGREGVLETLAVLKKQKIKAIGAGENKKQSHQPAIVHAGKYKIGLLGYYWNQRTSATNEKAGSAMDTNEQLKADIVRLRPLVDQVVVTFHWGIPYEKYPLEEDIKKAHFAIDSGADLVIGHHPHIVQPFELYKNKPIFYSIGNFAFGSGNSKAESLVLGVNFNESETEIILFPAYIKNRDKRINYQPKIITGETARESINRLKQKSGDSGNLIHIKNNTGIIILKR